MDEQHTTLRSIAPSGWELFLMVAGILMLVLATIISSVHAQGTNETGGLTSGEVNLDTANQMTYGVLGSENIAGVVARNLPFVGGVVSIVQDTIETQFQHKEQAASQDTALMMSEQNLENSKQNVAVMFGFIISTFVLLFDLLLSIIYIVMLLVFIWVIFTGWAKFMILIIDFLHGRYKVRKGRP